MMQPGEKLSQHYYGIIVFQLTVIDIGMRFSYYNKYLCENISSALSNG